MERNIVTIEEKRNEKILRKRAEEVHFTPEGCAFGGTWLRRARRTVLSRKELSALLVDMKKTMQAANGIGLSANQIGINAKFFVAQVPDEKGKPVWYAIFNPKIEKSGTRIEEMEEGCLSIPRTYGTVPRADRITLTGFDKGGKPLRIKAQGLLARVFQHEVDHLNGKLFIDRAKEIHKVPESERLSKEKEGV